MIGNGLCLTRLSCASLGAADSPNRVILICAFLLEGPSELPRTTLAPLCVAAQEEDAAISPAYKYKILQECKWVHRQAVK